MIELQNAWEVELKDGRRGVVLAIADANTLLVGVTQEDQTAKLEVHPRDAVVLLGRLTMDKYSRHSLEPESLEVLRDSFAALIKALGELKPKATVHNTFTKPKG